jgi:hypothetical protein
VCGKPTCDPGSYLGEAGCLDCPLCENCGDLCKVCECDDDDASDGAEEPIAPPISSKSKQKERNETAVTKSAASGVSAVVMVGALMTGSHNTFVSLFMTVELLSLLPLINMNLTTHQVDLLQGTSQRQSFPGLLSDMECNSPRPPRRNFDFDCSGFLRNSQHELLILCGLGIAGLVLWVLVWVFADCLTIAKEVLMKALPIVRKTILMVSMDLLVKAAYSAQLTGVESVEEVFSWIMIVVVWLLFLALCGVSSFVACGKFSSYPLLKLLLLNDVKSSTSSQLHFCLLILHRIGFGLFIMAMDVPKVQLLLLSVITSAVTPMQLATYLLLVRPYQHIRDSILELGTHCVVSGFLCFLMLFEFEVLGNDQDLVSSGFACTVVLIFGLHIAGIMAALLSKIREICLCESQGLPVIGLV